MGGCFSGTGHDGASASKPNANHAKDSDTPQNTLTAHSRASGSGSQAPNNIGRISMSSEKAADNKEYARHSRANSRTSLASLGDVSVMDNTQLVSDSHGEKTLASKSSTAAFSTERVSLPNKASTGPKPGQKPGDPWD